ncbi:hypothetical protein MANES_16G040350v8 [Manihot esculenta]|uniref:Uncharacterized protein n=1 Tax=Manihot esculenta TaxID=3983 RepID=A0ACB7G6F4_MANES|nr:hypothetical protein MANES_16G040350v8 [Manihot esculenta]
MSFFRTVYLSESFMSSRCPFGVPQEVEVVLCRSSGRPPPLASFGKEEKTFVVLTFTCSIALQNISPIFWCCLHLFHCPSEYLAGFLLALRAGERVVMSISLGL